MLRIVPNERGEQLNFYTNGTKVGQCQIFSSFYVENAIELWAFGLYGEHRGKGYGQQFLREIVQHYATDTIILFVEKTNTRALHIYTKAGFRIVGEYRGGSHAWEMRLER